MTLPSEHELKGVIVHILTRARDEGRLSELTVRIVLQDLAAHYGVEQNAFHTKSYKPFIKATVHATVASFRDAPGEKEEEEEEEDEGELPQSKKVKDDKSDGKAKTGKRKRPSFPSANEEPSEEVSASESNVRPPKKISARSKLSKVKDNQTVDKPAKHVCKTSKKPESESKFKSKAIVESSDEEAEPEAGSRKSARSPKKEKASVKSPSKQRSKQKVNEDHSNVEMDTCGDPGPSSSGSKPKPATESLQSSTTKSKELTRDPMESELSSVVDEPQTKWKKKQGKEPAKPQKDEKTKRGKKEPLSKDEETVNRLKAIVLACGVRKVWKKEFEGLGKPSQQIKRLHSILGDLGMTPRYSLDKAKALREERELAQELKDVQEFDKALKRGGKGLRGSSETAESMDSDASDEDVPVRKKQNARASIMAFLQDQSEEE